MILLLYFLLSTNSCYFLRLSPGVMSQGLGGCSIMIDEGLSAFHNPSLINGTKFNFTLSRWLYSTNLFSFGSSYKDNGFGLNYLSYGAIQGFDESGVPTNIFNPYNLSLALARKIGPFGIAIKTFQEKIDDYSLFGICGAVSSYLAFEKISIGAKIDNLGKEFAENTEIPFTTALGLKFTLPKDMAIIFESKAPDFEINCGFLYKYENIKLLLGTKYLMFSKDVVADFSLRSSDFDFSGGIMMILDNYEIGYSFVYTQFSTAHQFSIIFTP